MYQTGDAQRYAASLFGYNINCIKTIRYEFRRASRRP
jgi:hypothetical protein